MARTNFSDDFRRNFLTGVAALFPILITLFLFSWLYGQIDATLGKRATAVCRWSLASTPVAFRVSFPGASDAQAATFGGRLDYAEEHLPPFIGTLLGLVVVAVGVYLIGGFLRGYVGGRVMRAVNRLFERFPVIKAVYPHARQVGDFLFGQSERRRFRRVVAVQYPRRGVYSVGFLTGEGLKDVEQDARRKLVTVFIPTSPTPVTGFIIVLPADEVVYLDMTVDEAFRYCITAGMVASARQRSAEGPEGVPSPDVVEQQSKQVDVPRAAQGAEALSEPAEGGANGEADHLAGTVTG